MRPEDPPKNPKEIDAAQQSAQHLAESDPKLGELLSKWPALSAAVKDALLAMARASG